MAPDEPTLEQLGAEPAESVVRTYLERWDAHDLEGMLALLGDGLVFEWANGAMRSYRENWIRTSAWSMAAGFEITGYELAVDDDEEAVHVTLERTNRAYELLDLRLPPQELTFRVVDGIIETITYHLLPKEDRERSFEAYREALAPVIAWTKEHRPWAAEEFFTRGTVLNVWGETARERRRRAGRQVVLLEDCRNATELADLTKDQLHSFKWRLDPDGHSTGTISLFYPHPETGETVWDNRRLGWRSLEELPAVLSKIIRSDGRQKGEWRA